MAKPVITRFCLSAMVIFGQAVVASAGEAEIVFRGGAPEVALAGSLWLPESNRGRLPPVIVLLSGSGQQDRDLTVPRHQPLRPFARIAKAFASRGIGTLRFDDRGGGGSTGTPVQSLDDEAADALAALAYLCTRSDIDPNRIGVLGHSSGALAAASAIRARAGVAFAILLAGPSLRADRVLRMQIGAKMRAIDAAEERIAASIAVVDRLIAATLLGDADLKAEVEAIAHEQNKDMTWEDYQVSVFAWPWLRSALRYDPMPGLRALDGPVLAVFGDADLRVDARLNSSLAKQAFSGSLLARVVTLADHNHLFQHVDPEQRAIAAGPLPSDELLTLTADWIEAQKPSSHPLCVKDRAHP